MKSNQENLASLEEVFGYNFKNRNLLTEALSHPSLKSRASSKLQDYERLEFLGDAVLNLVISEYLFSRFPDYDEGRLAKARSHLVCKNTICQIGNKVEMSNFIIMSSGEEQSGGRENPNNIENAIEAILGAIYIDGGISKCRDVIINLWGEFLSKETSFDEIDPKTSLQEWAQGKGMQSPSYNVTARSGKDHSPIFEVMVTIGDIYMEYGSGKSIKYAEKNAAMKLLSKVRS